ncbi:MAG: 50S ribosomal protein L29 [Candidatus Omnitrophota bacterium]
MKAKDVRNMTEAEIEQKLHALKEHQFKLREELITGRVERPHVFRLVKRDIARCNTILKEKRSESGKTE